MSNWLIREASEARTLISGHWAELTLSGVILDRARLDANGGVGLIVRAMTSSTLVFSTNTKLLGVGIPDEGPFTAEIELQMNVSPGVYTIEAVFKDQQTNKITHGPWVSVKVAAATKFAGIKQMNPRIRFVPASRIVDAKAI